MNTNDILKFLRNLEGITGLSPVIIPVIDGYTSAETMAMYRSGNFIHYPFEWGEFRGCAAFAPNVSDADAIKKIKSLKEELCKMTEKGEEMNKKEVLPYHPSTSLGRKNAAAKEKRLLLYVLRTLKRAEEDLLPLKGSKMRDLAPKAEEKYLQTLEAIAQQKAEVLKQLGDAVARMEVTD